MIELLAFLLPVVPLLGLVVSLLLGRYPGCETIVRLAERIEATCRAKLGRKARRVASRRPQSHAPAGGLLLARSLSGRAPPATA